MTTYTQNLLEVSKMIIWVLEKFPADKAAINMMVEQLPKLKKAVAAFEPDAEFKGILHELPSTIGVVEIKTHPASAPISPSFGGTATIHG